MIEQKKVSFITIIGNIILFISKIIVGLMFQSIALISDAINSFTDILASCIVHVSVLVSHKEADKEHQFGHERAQPIAGLIVAIFTGIVGFQVIIGSIEWLMEGSTTEKGLMPFLIVIMVIIVKLALYIYTRRIIKKKKSTALSASAVDHRNDVLISATVLIGILFSNLGYPILEPIVAIIIGIWIIRSGFYVGKDNIGYLMGVAPAEELFDTIEKKAKTIKGVIGINDMRAHYVGTAVEVEIHIYVDKELNIKKAHSIGKQVEKKVESIDEICKAFIHIDPFLGKYVKERKFS
jgi:cation diffusion facilitator family transporter